MSGHRLAAELAIERAVSTDCIMIVVDHQDQVVGCFPARFGRIGLGKSAKCVSDEVFVGGRHNGLVSDGLNATEFQLLFVRYLQTSIAMCTLQGKRQSANIGLVNNT